MYMQNRLTNIENKCLVTKGERERWGQIRPWGRWGLETTERLHFHFSLSCIGEGNGNPLQCSCLENPRDGEAWWAAVYGVAQSWTWLKWLSSSSGSRAYTTPTMVYCLIFKPLWRGLLLLKRKPRAKYKYTENTNKWPGNRVGITQDKSHSLKWKQR